jgi:hypothetical protein
MPEFIAENDGLPSQELGTAHLRKTKPPPEGGGCEMV